MSLERVFLRPSSALGLLAIVLGGASCRNANGNGPVGQSIAPNAEGANGCSGPDQVFTVGQTPTPLAHTTLVIGTSSCLAAARGAEVLYATGADATVVALDVTSGVAVETELVAPGTIAALLLTAGISATPELSGIAVLDLDTLVVVENTSNTLISVDRSTPDIVGFFAGQPNTSGGFADGLATGTTGPLARFDFSEPTSVCPTGDASQRVFVADVGNHAIRMVGSDGIVRTIAGGGSAFFADGVLDGSFFDTPTGLAIACNSRLVVSERGANGFGNRLRALEIGASNPLGGFFGSATTLAGDGTNATAGGASLAGAELARPEAPILTATGELYWVDSATGVLRRRTSDGTCDCPVHADCANAVATPEFTAGHRFSMAATPAGNLYVLDADMGTLERITP